MTTLLDVRRLTVNFFSEAGTVTPVDDVSFQLAKGETLALVGESGCGKSLTALSILQLLPRAASIGPGSTIELDGQDLVPLDEAALRAVRGARIAMIFQDPMTSQTRCTPPGARSPKPSGPTGTSASARPASGPYICWRKSASQIRYHASTSTPTN